MPALPLTEPAVLNSAGLCLAKHGEPFANVWFVDRTETGWSEPQFVGPPLNDYQPVYFSIANDGTLYFTRSSPRGIYYAEPEDGQYLEAHRLPDEINFVRDVAHPAVAPMKAISCEFLLRTKRSPGRFFVHQFQKAGWVLDQSGEHARCLAGLRSGCLCILASRRMEISVL